jgi:hypothetical protein
MALFKSCEGWMKFPYLDVNEGLEASFTLGWKMTDNDADPWSARFVRFKRAEDMALYGAAKMVGGAIPPLMKALALNPARTVIIPALSSAERSANKDRHIPRIAAALGAKFGIGVDRTAVTKNPHAPIKTAGGAAARRALLEKANYRADPVDADAILLLDDFITRGDTLSVTAQALLKANPKLTVYGVALGKTERLAYRPEINNDHVPKAWDELWKLGEQNYLQKHKAKP